MIAVVICCLYIDDGFLRILFLFLVIFISAFLSLGKKFRYAYILGGATAFMVLFTSFSGAHQLLETAAWRCIEVFLGVFVVAIDSLALKIPVKPVLAEAKPPIFRTKKSIAVAVSGIVTAVICLWLQWYGGAVGVVSAFVVSLVEDETGKLLKGIERLAGCLVGAAIGLFLLIFVSHSAVVLLIIIFAVSLCYTFFHYAYPSYSYLKLQAMVAFLIAVLPKSNILSSNVSPALERVAGIMIGVAVAVLVNTLFNHNFRVWRTTSRDNC